MIETKNKKKEEMKMNFSKRLKLCRKKKGMTQKEVADKLNFKYSTISNYENGTRWPNFETLAKFANLYEVSIDYLIRGQEFIGKNRTTLTIFFRNSDILLVVEGLTEEEIEDIRMYMEFVKWKREQK
jgi:transcriptional regulator with XRE-family HTH domain